MTRGEGKSWRDDIGFFYPLGGTLLWALSGWRDERDRLKQNLSFLADHRFDYVRITGDLAWAGQDASNSEFECLLGELIDCAYGNFGLKTEITAFAGPSPRDPLMVARKVRAVAQTRQDKVLFIEPANESAQSGPDEKSLDDMVMALIGAVPLVASSTPMGDNNSGQWNTWLDARKARGANVATIHFDRTAGDDDWRFVRQPWDFRDRDGLKCNNEGKGPRSSVSETTNIPRIVAFRLMSILAGSSAFCLHNGAGVAGKVDPAHNRPANLWEVPGIDAIMTAVRGLDKILPERVESWQKTTQHGGWAFGGFENFSNPLTADAIWSDQHGHGASRCYGAKNGNQFLTPVYGIDKFVKLRNEGGKCLAKAYDIVSQTVVEEKSLEHGAEWQLPASVGTEAAYLIVGEYM